MKNCKKPNIGMLIDKKGVDLSSKRMRELEDSDMTIGDLNLLIGRKK